MNLLRGSVAGRCPILPSVVWTEGWGSSVPFSALSPSVLGVNPQVFMPVERAGGALNGWVAHPLSFQGAVCSGAFYPPSTGSILNSPDSPFS